MVGWLPNSVACNLVYFNLISFNFNTHGALFYLNNIGNIALISNSLCDPVIYGLRLAVVRQGYRNMFKRFCTQRQPPRQNI